MKKQETNNTALAVTDFLDEIEHYVTENAQNDFSSDDIITPRMRIIQSGSPQVKKLDQKYIKGAEEGMIFNSATGELFDGGGGFLMIPCYFLREWIEWLPKSAGGGLVKRWGDDDSFKTLLIPEGDCKARKIPYNPENPPTLYCPKNGKWINGDTGTEIVQTANYYILVYVPGTGRFYPAILGLSGTDFKKSRPLASKIKESYYINSKGESKKAPYQYYTYLVRTIPEQNDKGSWYGFKIDQDKPIIDLPNFRLVWEASVEFRKLILEGKIKTIDEQPESPLNEDASEF